MRFFKALRVLVFSVVTAASVHGHGFDVLIFTKTDGFTHNSIPAGITAIENLGTLHDFGVTQTDDATTFISELPNHQVVVFLNTTGDILNESQQTAFQTWYQGAKGFVGIHAACDTEHGWPWYLELVGAEFESHGPVQSGTVEVLDRVHPITNSGSPRVLEWTINEEWYNFVESPRGKVHVLAVVDELVTTTNPFGDAVDTGITGGTHGSDHPIMWCRRFDGGRTAYLGPGHESATFSDPTFLDYLVNSIEWAAGETGGESSATIDGSFEKVLLEDQLSNPMAIDVASDGRVFLIERLGQVKMHDQANGVTSQIGALPVYSGGEYGGLAIALAPDFETSSHLYIQWALNGSDNTRVSRFTLDAYGILDLNSEVVILEYPTNRLLSGHHQSGCLRFGPSGDLFIGVGDNTQASGYSPRNDGSIGRDARKSAPNTNDLRGKILRITPDIGGGPQAHPNYTIPAGNLFPPGTPLAREEIYVMGCRNPFAFCVDPVNGWIYFGDVGPDATNSGSGAFEGAGGHDEFNQVKAPGWFGWPYYIGDNKPYFDGSASPWNAATIQSDLANYFTLGSFAGSGAVGGDPTLLPAPEPAWIWYPDQEAAPDFLEVGAGQGRCAMAGAVYQHQSGHNLPAYYDGSVFLMLWSRDAILEAKLRPDGSLLELTEFAPDLSFDGPHDMRIGPDGAMYLIEWGSSDLVKVQYTPDVATPVAVASADVTSGDVPLSVQFSSAGSFDPDSSEIYFSWDFDGDQIVDSTDANPAHVFGTVGTYTVQLTVADGEGVFSRANVTISAGNHAPIVTFSEPTNLNFFDWGDTVDFAFSVADNEDGTSAEGEITDSEVTFEASLLHTAHLHNEVQENTLAGNLWITRDESHPFDLDLGFVLEARYTDTGASGVDPITASTRVTLQPKVTMAQSYDGHSGVAKEPTLDPVGGDEDVTSIDDGDHVYFKGLNLDGIHTIRLRASASGSGGGVEIRQDSPMGNLIGTVQVPSTGSDFVFQDFETSLSGVLSGSRDLYFVFSESGATDLMRLNWINFRGQGATRTPELPAVSGISVPAADTLRISFDQEMDFATLASTSNYAVNNGAVITLVTPAADQTHVDLLFSGVMLGAYYTVSLSGLEDLAGDAIAAGTEVTFLHRSAPVSEFHFGLNAGAGPHFTDSSGDLYISDDTATLLVDFNPSSSLVTSTPMDFAVADAAINLNGAVNRITASPTTPQPLVATNLSGATITNTGTPIFDTDKGNLDDVPILDSYLYTDGSQTTTLEGLGDIADGAEITLTLWGVGDSAGSDTNFSVSHGGASIGSQTTDYDTATPLDTSPARVRFVFNKSASDDSIIIAWSKASTGTCGFNGLSLTTPHGTAGTGSYYNDGTARSYTQAISNTDDEVLYQSERHRSNGILYSIPLDSGTYDVLLRFTENYFDTTGSRAFNVQIEGGSPEFSPELDIVAESGGKNVAFNHLVSGVQVTDGLLEIDFVPGSANHAKINAIGIFRQVVSVTPLPDPSFARYLESHPDSLQSISSDVDRDGLSTLLEYALGGSDSTVDVGLLPVIEPSEGGEFSLVFDRPEGLPDVTYEVLASNDLSTWELISAAVDTNSLGGGQEEVEFNGLIAAAVDKGLSAGGGLYFRLQVNLVAPQ